MKVKLEAGAAYYFAQNLIGGWTAYDTALTMHSKELVEFEASNAVYAQWK